MRDTIPFGDFSYLNFSVSVFFKNVQNLREIQNFRQAKFSQFLGSLCFMVLEALDANG